MSQAYLLVQLIGSSMLVQLTVPRILLYWKSSQENYAYFQFPLNSKALRCYRETTKREVIKLMNSNCLLQGLMLKTSMGTLKLKMGYFQVFVYVDAERVCPSNQFLFPGDYFCVLKCVLERSTWIYEQKGTTTVQTFSVLGRKFIGKRMHVQLLSIAKGSDSRKQIVSGAFK